MKQILKIAAFAALTLSSSALLAQGYYYNGGTPIVISGGSVSGAAAPSAALVSAIYAALGDGPDLYAKLTAAGGAVDGDGNVTAVIDGLKDKNGKALAVTITVTPDGTIKSATVR